MVALNLLELFTLVFFLIFLVILIYAVIRRFCCPSKSSDQSQQGKKKKNSSVRVGSSSSDTSNNNSSNDNSNNSNPSGPVAPRTVTTTDSNGNRQTTIYLGAGSQVGNINGRSVYTIPINSLNLSSGSVVVVRTGNSGTGSAITLRLPQPIVDEPPPYEDCVRVTDPVGTAPPSYSEHFDSIV